MHTVADKFSGHGMNGACFGYLLVDHYIGGINDANEYVRVDPPIAPAPEHVEQLVAVASR